MTKQQKFNAIENYLRSGYKDIDIIKLLNIKRSTYYNLKKEFRENKANLPGYFDKNAYIQATFDGYNSIEDLCKMLGISRQTIYKKEKEGLLKSICCFLSLFGESDTLISNRTHTHKRTVSQHTRFITNLDEIHKSLKETRKGIKDYFDSTEFESHITKLNRIIKLIGELKQAKYNIPSVYDPSRQKALSADEYI